MIRTARRMSADDDFEGDLPSDFMCGHDDNEAQEVKILETDVEDEKKKNLRAEFESLLEPYLSDEEEPDELFDEVDDLLQRLGHVDKVKTQTNVMLVNKAYMWDEDREQDHILLMRNSPNLRKLVIGEDDPFFPDPDDDSGDCQWEATGIYLGNHTFLKELGFGSLYGVIEGQFSDMCKGLTRNSSITKLTFKSETIFDGGQYSASLEALTPFLQKGNITHLSIIPEQYIPFKLGSRGILRLALMLTKFSSLKEFELIELCDGDINDELMTRVFDALATYHPELSSINLSGTTLGRNAKDALSKLDVNIETERKSSGPGGIGGLAGGVDSIFERLERLTTTGLPSRHSSSQKAPRAVIPTKVKPGILCEVNGLKSQAGSKLNGRRCAIIRYVEEDERYAVRMENETGKDATFALKEANLTPLEKLVLPTHSYRGSEGSPRSLCELLLYYKGSGPFTKPEFSPSSIALTGYAARQLNHIGNVNLMWLVQCQIEQLAGVVGLASTCSDYEEEGAEETLFALLEGDPMYVDVLIQTIHWTGLIDHESCDEKFNGFNDAPTLLTPDQDSKPYVKLMSTGPLRLLVEMTQYKFGSALWSAMKESEFYPLFLQRLLRLIGREKIGTHDGVKLGPLARKILMNIIPGVCLERRLKCSETASNLLAHTSREQTCTYLHADTTAEFLNTKFFLRFEE